MTADNVVHDVLGVVSLSLMWCGISDSFSLCSDGLVSQDEEDEGDEAFESGYKEELTGMQSPNLPFGSERMRMTRDGLEVSLSVSEEELGRNYLGQTRRSSKTNEHKDNSSSEPHHSFGRSSEVFRRKTEYGRESPGFRDEAPPNHYSASLEQHHYQHQHQHQHPPSYPGHLAIHPSSSGPRLEGTYSHASYAEPSSAESTHHSYHHHRPHPPNHPHHPLPPPSSYGHPGEVFPAAHTASFDSHHGRAPPPPRQVVSMSYNFGPTPPPPSSYPYYNHWSTPHVEYITVIKPGDVLSGRGGATNSHSGNRNFRSLVKEFQSQYLKAKKRDKPAVASIIVEKVREKNGRFLRRVGTNSQGEVLWVDIGDDRAREKTCQALREGAPELRRKRKATSSSGDDEGEETSPRSASRDSEVGGGAMTSYSASIDQSTSADQEEDHQASWRGKRTPSNEESKESQLTNPRFRLDEPIMIRPSAKLLHRRISTPISVDELNVQDREIYLRDFLPPNPEMRRKTAKPRYIVASHTNYDPSSGREGPADEWPPPVVRV